MSKKERKEKKNYFDYTLLFLVLFMIAFGLVMLYSTSYHYAETHFHDATFYLRKQAIATGIGLVLMFFTTMVPYNFWKKFAIPAYLLSCGLSIAVLIVSDKINGSARWLNIGGMSFQPAELAKIAVILFTARYICQAPKSMGRIKNMLKTVAWLLPISGIVALSNLSSAIIIFMIGMVIIFHLIQFTRIIIMMRIIKFIIAKLVKDSLLI